MNKITFDFQDEKSYTMSKSFVEYILKECPVWEDNYKLVDDDARKKSFSIVSETKSFEETFFDWHTRLKYGFPINTSGNRYEFKSNNIEKITVEKINNL